MPESPELKEQIEQEGAARIPAAEVAEAATAAAYRALGSVGGSVRIVEQLEFVSGGKPSQPVPAPGEPPVSSEPQITSVPQARTILEGLLFLTNEPLSVARLSKFMDGLSHQTIRGLLLELQMDYEHRAGAIAVIEVAEGFQLATRPHLNDYLVRLQKSRKTPSLSPTTLETLAIIAYKQPITRTEIESIRGVDSANAVRTLVELGLIDVSGRREVPGRPQLYVTTPKFLVAFGLKSLADLPSISELRARFAEELKFTPSQESAPSAEGEPAAAGEADVGAALECGPEAAAEPKDAEA